MSNQLNSPSPDQLEELLADLEVEAEAAARLGKRLSAQSNELEGATDSFVDEIAHNLAIARHLAGLPSKDPGYFKELIERRRVAV